MHKRLYYAQEIILYTREYSMHKRVQYAQEITLCNYVKIDYIMCRYIDR